MAPTRNQKRKSTESISAVEVQHFSVPPKMAYSTSGSPARTPSRSPIKKTRIGITVAQKQALIDNLQLEITERARKLRAQYMLQAQGLRTRIEIRVNRIPIALRKANMGALFSKHNETAQKTQTTKLLGGKVASPYKSLVQDCQHDLRASPSPQRTHKRPSTEIFAEDKENEDIENPKKRLRQAPNPAGRAVSRKIPPSQVLSPRSANSRTLPRSPVRPTLASPGKSYLARPLSPLKPTAPAPAGGAAGILTNMVEKAKSKGATVKKVAEPTAPLGRPKRNTAPAVPPKIGRGKGRPSVTSDTSEGSNSTTIVRKPAPPPKIQPVKKGVMGTIRAMGAKKAAPAPRAAPATGTGRVLRKRN